VPGACYGRNWDAGGQSTVRTGALLVPPLEQPTSPVLPAAVFTATLKFPRAGIIEEVMVPASWELLVTAVAIVAPLKTISDGETN
jgi:hypothetical protein